jgi:hypothetical protein
MGTRSAKRCWEGGRPRVVFERTLLTELRNASGFSGGVGIASELCGFTLNAGDRDCIPSGVGVTPEDGAAGLLVHLPSDGDGNSTASQARIAREPIERNGSTHTRYLMSYGGGGGVEEPPYY